MKKTITCIAAAFTAVTLLASCGGGSSPAAKSPEDEVRQTATAFMDACLSYDLDKATGYVTDEDLVEIPDIIESMEDGMGEYESMIPDKDKDAIRDKIVKIVRKHVSYDIDEITVEDDEANVTLTVKEPDLTTVDSDAFSESDLMDIMEDSFGFDITDGEAFMEEYAKRKGVDMDDLYSIFSSGDQDELISDVYNTFKNEFDSLVDNMLSMMDDAMDTADDEETEVDLTLEKQSDGQWLISDVY